MSTLCVFFREVEEGGKVNGGVITLKFEPFILHVQCRDTEAAKRLHTISLEAGYRNSGITLGKSGKVTLAVRYYFKSKHRSLARYIDGFNLIEAFNMIMWALNCCFVGQPMGWRSH